MQIKIKNISAIHPNSQGSCECVDCDLEVLWAEFKQILPLKLAVRISIPELTNLGGKQHPIGMIFPLFPSNFTINFPLSPTENDSLQLILLGYQIHRST